MLKNKGNKGNKCCKKNKSKEREKKNQEQKEEPCCFICFEVQKKDEYPIELKHQDLCIKMCNCNGFIHLSCLELWYRTCINKNINTTKCPICRTEMKNKVLKNENENENYGNFVNEDNSYIIVIFMVSIYLSLIYKFIIFIKILFDNII